MRRDIYFNAEAAQAYGVDGAVMLHHIVYWVVYNEANGLNRVDGYTWTYNSARAYKQFFPWWSADQIRRVLRNLESDGAIVVGNHNKLGMDRTKWYTLRAAVAVIYDLRHFEEYQYAFRDSLASISANVKMHSVKPQDHYQVINTSKKPSEKNQVTFPWEDDAFQQLWEEWKADRRERKIKPYTQRGEQAALHKLQTDSGGRVDVAMSMIQNSIANGYQGIFPPKRTAQSQRGSSIDPDSLISWAAQGGT